MSPINLYIASSLPGVTYKVKQICAEPLRFIAYVVAPPVPEQPINREGVCLLEALDHVGRHALALHSTVNRLTTELFGEEP